MRRVGATVVKLNTKSAAIASGGSMRSWSVTFAARTVTVHDSAMAKSASGFSVNDVGPPAAVAVCTPLAAQAMANQAPLTFTGSAKVTSTLASSATPDAPLAGAVEATAGGWALQLPGADAVLRGAGAAATESGEVFSG